MVYSGQLSDFNSKSLLLGFCCYVLNSHLLSFPSTFIHHPKTAFAYNLVKHEQTVIIASESTQLAARTDLSGCDFVVVNFLDKTLVILMISRRHLSCLLPHIYETALLGAATSSFSQNSYRIFENFRRVFGYVPLFSDVKLRVVAATLARGRTCCRSSTRIPPEGKTTI